ncbi:MAG: hypothetical protein R8P61_23830 [Bacteroidia bacterium]|nr:hypothetical protein [Bacteroidia bacterium]
MASPQRIINGTGFTVEFSSGNSFTSASPIQTIKPGEAQLITQLAPTAYSARDAHSKVMLRIIRAESQNALLITDSHLNSQTANTPVQLSFHNTSLESVEIGKLEGGVTEVILKAGEKRTISAYAHTVYQAKLLASGTVIQTFIPNDSATQNFPISLGPSASYVSSSLNIKNASSLSLLLQWIDFDGSLKRDQKLDPGMTVKEKTFCSHPWILRDRHSGFVLDTCIGSYTNKDWIFTAEGLKSVQNDTTTEIEFWNTTPFTIDIIGRDHRGTETSIGQLEAGARLFQSAKAGQVFEMLRNRDARILQSFVASSSQYQLCKVIQRDEALYLPPEISFDNNSGLTVELLAKDEEGVERIFTSIPNRGIQSIPANTADRWLIRDKQSGLLMEEVISSNENFTHSINATGFFSREMSIAVEAEFVNTTPFTLDIAWIDYDGKEEHFHRLKSGESLKQPTHATHVWRIRERESREVLLLYVANEQASQQVDIVMKPLRSREPALLYFRNFTGLTTEVVWFDEAGKAKVLETLIPGQKTAYNTFASHAWVLRDKGSKTVLKTIIARPGKQTVDLKSSLIRSKRSDRSAKLLFKNKMPFAVDLYWIDYDGMETPHETLRSGEQIEKDSYTTHPYRFRHHTSQKEVGVFLPTEEALQEVNIALRAYPNDEKAELEVRNMTTLTVQVFKVDTEGKEVFELELTAREGKKINTFKTQPVIVRDKLSKEPVAYTITGTKSRILEISGDDLRSNRTDFPVWISWKNSLSLPVDLYWVKYDGSEELMESLGAQESKEISSYPSHVWKAKFHHSGTEVDLYICGKKDKQVRNIGAIPPLRQQHRPNGELWPGEIALYEDINFGGRTWIAHGDLPDFSLIPDFDNRISSIQVGPKTAVTVFRDKYFNALPPDPTDTAAEIRKVVEKSAREVMDEFKVSLVENMDAQKAQVGKDAFSQKVNLIVSFLEQAASESPRQFGYIIERFVLGTPFQEGETLSQIQLNFGSVPFESALQAILASPPASQKPDEFASQIEYILNKIAEALKLVYKLEWEGRLAGLSFEFRESAKGLLTGFNNHLSYSAEKGTAKANGESDVFHMDIMDLNKAEIGQGTISSLRLLRTYSAERLRISSTNKLAEDPQIIKEGGKKRLLSKPVYRTTIKFPPEVSDVHIWGTEDTLFSAGGKTHSVGPHEDQFAHIKLNPGGILVLQIKPEHIGVPPLMLRTNNMPANSRIFLYPDADVHRKIASLPEDAFEKGIPDPDALGGRRKLTVSPGKEELLPGAQKAIQELSRTSASLNRDSGTGTEHDRNLATENMSMSAFELDFRKGVQAADSAFRPIAPITVQELASQATDSENAGQDFWNALGEFFRDPERVFVTVGETIVREVGQVALDFWDSLDGEMGNYEEDAVINNFVIPVGGTIIRAGETFVDVITHPEKIPILLEKGIEVIQQGLQIVIQAAGKLVKIVVKTLEEVGRVIEEIAIQVAESVGDFIDFLSSLFNWDDILKTHDMLSGLLDQAFTRLDHEIGIFQQKTHDYFTSAQEDVKEMMSAARRALGVEDLEPLEGNSVLSDIMDALMWIVDKISMAASMKSKLIDKVFSAKDEVMDMAGLSLANSETIFTLSDELEEELERASEIFSKLVGEIAIEGLESAFESFESIGRRIGQIIEDPQRAPELLAAIFLDIGEIFMLAGLEIVKILAHAFFELGKVLLKLVKIIIDKEIEIPFISDLYELISGGRALTPKSMACLLLALPVTIGGKLAFGVEKFRQTSVAQEVKTENILLYIYGSSHIILGISEALRGATSMAGKGKRLSNWKNDFGFDLVMAGVSWGASILAISTSIPSSSQSRPYPKGFNLSEVSWSMQIVELIFDIIGELGSEVQETVFKVNTKNGDAFQLIMGIINIGTGITHLVINCLFLAEEEAKGEIKGQKMHMNRTALITTTLPPILGGGIDMLNGRNQKSAAGGKNTITMVISGLLIAGQFICHQVEAGVQMGLAALNEGKQVTKSSNGSKPNT